MNGHAPVQSLPDILRVLRRRKWFVVVAVALAAAAAVGVSSLQEQRFAATAEVLLTEQNLALGIDRAQDPNRLAQTQVRIARVPALAARVLRTGGLDETPQSFLDRSQVVANQQADILEFSVEAASAASATRLATAYAHAFTKYRRDLGRAAFARSERLLEAQLAELRDRGAGASATYEETSADLEQLRRASLSSPDAVVLRAADDAEQVQPRTVRNVVLAGLLGLLIGICAAGIAESFDTRVRSSAEVTAALGLPALGRVSGGRSAQRGAESLPLIASPLSPEAEAFRMLRGSLDMSLRESGAKVVLVGSALSSEGKTDTAANLAVAFAQTGRRVVAVDLDLRRPELASLLGAKREPGITDVATGSHELDEALVRVPFYDHHSILAPLHAARRQGGELLVLPAGTQVADPGVFVGSKVVAHVLNQLRQRADVVLVDTPPLLQAGDAVSLGDAVDAMLVVVRAGLVDGPALEQLADSLGRIRAIKLGFALAGARAVDLPRPYLAA